MNEALNDVRQCYPHHRTPCQACGRSTALFGGVMINEEPGEPHSGFRGCVACAESAGWHIWAGDNDGEWFAVKKNGTAERVPA